MVREIILDKNLLVILIHMIAKNLSVAVMENNFDEKFRLVTIRSIVGIEVKVTQIKYAY